MATLRGPLCVHCLHPAPDLYKQYLTAIRLTRCSICSNFTDKYSEYEFNLKLLDLILLKATAYRHFLFNNMPYQPPTGFSLSLAKVLVIYSVFDVYLWMIQFNSSVSFAIWTTACDYILFLGTVVILSLKAYPAMESNYIVMLMVLSNFGKFILGIMIIWDYPIVFTLVISAFVMVSNIAALASTTTTNTPCSYATAASIVAAAEVNRVVLYYILGVLPHGHRDFANIIKANI